jgi:hypothetical protein
MRLKHNNKLKIKPAKRNIGFSKMLCPIKRKANAQAKSANAHIAFFANADRKNRKRKN